MRAGQVISIFLSLACLWAMYFGINLIVRAKTRPSGDIADIYAVWIGGAISFFGLLILVIIAIGLAIDNRSSRSRDPD